MIALSSRILTSRFATDRRERNFIVALAGLAGGSFLISLFWAFVLPQTPGRMADPSSALIAGLPLWSFIRSLPLPIPRTGASLATALLLLSTARFGLYGLAVYLCWKRRAGKLSTGLVVGGALVFFLVAACAFPNVDRDIYNYILSGRVAAVYHSNPYYTPPDRFPNDPFYLYASQRYTHFAGDNKFPAWMLLNVLLAWLSGNGIITNLLFYRFLLLFFNIANVGLMTLILSKTQPRFLLAGVVLYGWNPIVDAYGQSKADTLMVFFLLLAILALVFERKKSLAVLLALSACVKLITLPLAPVYMLRQLRARRWRELAVGAACFGAAVVLLYAPFWQGPRMLLNQLDLVSGGGSAGRAAIGALLQIGFALACLWVGYRKDRGHRHLLRSWALIALLFSLFLTRLGFSWYLMTLIALVGVAVEWRLTLITIALSFASFMLNTWDNASNEVFALPDLLVLPRFLVYLAFVGAIGVAVLVVELARRSRQQRGDADLARR